MILKFSNNTKVISNKNKVVLGNIYTGQWIRIPKLVFDIFNTGIDNNLTLEKLKDYLYDDSDRVYIDKIHSELCKIGIIESRCSESTNKNKSILFEITNRCNLKCTHCCIDADELTSDKVELSMYEVKKSLDKIISWNPESITITGGEPLIRSDLFELLKYLRFNYKGQICLSTNGTLINKKNAQILIDTIDQIDISIDGLNEETCSIVRGKGVFNKVIDSVRLLQDLDFKNIHISMVFGNKNSHLKYEFINFNKNLGTFPVIRDFKPVGRGRDNKHIFYDKEESESILDREFVSGQFRKTFNICSCTAGKNEFFIRYNGDIHPCQAFFNKEYLIDNITKIESLYDLKSNDSKYECAYNNLKLATTLDNVKCKDCNVRLFCWPCPSEVESIIKNKECFEETCKEIKPILYKEIWGETL